MDKSTRKLGPGYAKATVGAKSLNLETRECEVSWGTGAPVLRNDPSLGRYYEKLTMDPKGVILTRMQGGVLLDTHNSDSIDNILGVVVRCWIENGIGRAIIRFSESTQGEKAMRMVQDGSLSACSIGYSPKAMRDVTTDKNATIPTYLVESYEVYELSMVGVPADSTAKVRNETEKQHEVEILLPIQNQENKMSDNKAQRLLELEIQNLVRVAKVDESLAAELIAQDGMTIEKARSAVFKVLEDKNPPISSNVRVDVGHDNASMRKRAFEEACLHRMDPKNFKLTELGRPLASRSLLVAAESIVERGMFESDNTYAKRAMSTSDFSLALANLAEKSLQMQYGIENKSYSRWTKSDTVRNFKQHSQVQLSAWPSLSARSEGAEYEYGAVGEKNEVVQIGNFGKIISFTSHSLVNDDLNAFQRLANSAGIACSRLDNRLAYEALTNNQVMQEDGNTLFHALHSNLGTAGAISETSLNEAFKMIMKQTSLDGLDKLNLQGKYLLVSPDKMTEAKKILAQIQAAQSSNVNPFSGSLELVVDAELVGNAWYIACDSSAIDTVTMYRLEGQESPQVSSQIKFETDDLLIKVSYSVGAAPMDYRGLFKNAGN